MNDKQRSSSGLCFPRRILGMFGRSYVELFEFQGRVGSRVKRILFLCHYVIPEAAAVAGASQAGVILAPWERIDAIFPSFRTCLVISPATTECHVPEINRADANATDFRIDRSFRCSFLLRRTAVRDSASEIELLRQPFQTEYVVCRLTLRSWLGIRNFVLFSIPRQLVVLLCTELVEFAIHLRLVNQVQRVYSSFEIENYHLL